MNAKTLNYLLVIKGENPNEDVVVICKSRPARRKATLEAVFGDPDYDLKDRKQAEGILEELDDRGFINFEGDPGLQWINAIQIKRPRKSLLPHTANRGSKPADRSQGKGC